MLTGSRVSGTADHAHFSLCPWPALKKALCRTPSSQGDEPIRLVVDNHWMTFTTLFVFNGFISATKWLQTMLNSVAYWPSTELSIKKCTCVNKRKNSGSRWTANKNITRTQTAWISCSWRQLGTRCRIESQQQTKGFGPSVTHGWATLAKMRKKCCYGRKKNLDQLESRSWSSESWSYNRVTVDSGSSLCNILTFDPAVNRETGASGRRYQGMTVDGLK